jgi:hypothetical protein
MIKKPKLLNEMLVQTPINAWVSTPSFSNKHISINDGVDTQALIGV